MHDLYRVTFVVIMLFTLLANPTYAKDRRVEFYVPHVLKHNSRR